MKQRRYRFLRLETLEPRQLMAVITTLAQLQSMSLSGNHVLGANIDASTAYFSPVGSESSPFTGSLNGSGYKITGLKINSGSPYVGLFGYTSNATLTDVVLENVDINATYGGEYPNLHVGGLVGKAVNTSISDSEVSGDIDADSYGGVYAGGLVGYSSNGLDKDLVGSISSASVDGRTDINNAYGGGYGGYVGGLVGRADGLDVSSSSATGPVTAYGGSAYGGQNHYAGGLIGYNYLSAGSGANAIEVQSSFATGYVKAYTGNPYGGAYAGGLIGYNSLASLSTGVASLMINQSHATGTAEADVYSFSVPYGGAVAFAGGLVGYNFVATSGSGSAAANITLSHATGLAESDANSYGGPIAYAGGLIGYNYNVSTSSGSATTNIDQTFAKGTADASGFNAASYGGTGSGSPYGYAGGLVGYSHAASSSTGTAATTIDESYATGTVNAYGSMYSGSYGGAYAGGLVGYDYLSKGASATASATISNTYATGNATARAPADASAGGLIGGVVATGTTAQVLNSFSIGIPDTQFDLTPLEGGLVGYSSNATYTSSYWNTQTSGKTDGVDNVDPDPSGVTGKTTQEMSSQSTFSGWDFDADGTGAGANGVWIMAGYPHLQMEYHSIQTVAGKKSITNVIELQMMALKLSESYELASDINASATTAWNWDGTRYQGFAPVSTEALQFTGSFDGQDHVIQTLTINRPSTDELGLFGFVSTTGTISSVGLEGVNVTSYGVASDNTGGIVGKNRGYISDSFVTGTVDGNDDVGGLVGENEGGTIERCFVKVTIPAHANSDDVGGLVGDNDGGTIRQSYSAYNAAGKINSAFYGGGLVGRNRNGGVIEDSYSAAEVQGGYSIGGLVGANSATITRSYSIGAVAGSSTVGGFVGLGTGGTYTTNYWNTQTSGTADGVADLTPDPSGVTGQTTQEMSSQSTFSGWDFDANGQGAGNNGVWIMAGYPHLQMEHNFIKTVGGAKNITNAVELQMMALSLAVDYILGNDIDASATSAWNWDGTAAAYDGFRPIGHDTDNTFVSNELEGVHFNGNPFTGRLDGNDYDISGLWINRPDEDFIGLFGKVEDSGLTEGNWEAHDAAILDLTLAEPRISGRRFVGGVAGVSDAKIDHAVVTAADFDKGTTSAYIHAGGLLTDIFSVAQNVGFNVGGLVGKAGSGNTTLSVISDSSSQIVVQHNTGSHLINAGGVAGQVNNAAKIVNSTAVGDVIAQIVNVPYTFNEFDNFGNLVSRSFDFNNHVGGLVGEHDGLARGDRIGGTQLYVEASGAVEGYRQVGGLIGALDGSVTFGRATGVVGNATAAVGEKAGGLVGKSEAGSTISWSYADVTVYGSRHAGGFIGENEGGAISDSYAIVDLRITLFPGDREECGGFAGQNSGGSITRCYATGSITGPIGERVGGFVGDNAGFSSITNSFANVTTPSGGSGFFGRNESGSTFSVCYSTVSDGLATATTLAALTATAGGSYTHAVYAMWDFDGSAPSWQVNVGALPTFL